MKREKLVKLEIMGVDWWMNGVWGEVDTKRL